MNFGIRLKVLTHFCNVNAQISVHRPTITTQSTGFTFTLSLYQSTTTQKHKTLI